MKFYTDVYAADDEILVRGYHDGKRYHERIKYKPKLYYEKVQNPTRAKPSDWTTLTGIPVEPQQFETMKFARFARYQAQDYGTPIYGLTNFAHTYIADTWPGEIEHDPSLLVIANIDIEVYAEDGFPKPEEAACPIVAITIKSGEMRVVFGLKDYKPPENVTYVQCADERLLLRRFLKLWKNLDPDIVTGWNITGFDIPYICNRLIKLLGHSEASYFSPWRIIKPHTFRGQMGKEIYSYTVAGLAVIDYLTAYRKFRLKMRESYRLDYIGHVELNMRKLDYEEYGSLTELYNSNHQLYLDYNIRDVEIVDKLDNKLGYISLITSVAYFAGCNLADVFQQTRVWDCICARELAKRKMVVPGFSEKVKTAKIAGAYVKPPHVGIHDWVVSFDAASLYPSNIITLNLGPETMDERYKVDVDFDKLIRTCAFDTQPGYAVAANGYRFSTDKRSFFAEIVETVLKRRAQQKDIMLEADREIEKRKANGEPHDDLDIIQSRANTMQQSLKVIANSLYGTLSSPYFRFFDIRIGEAITLTGQLIIQWTAARLNDYLNKSFGTHDVDYVIAQDTDSCYISLEPIARHAADPLQAVHDFAMGPLDAAIKAETKKLAGLLGVKDMRWKFKPETISDRAIWTGKKRYCLHMIYAEAGRLAEPEVKITGLEAVRSVVPEFGRTRLKKAYKICLKGTETEFHEFCRKAREEFDALPPEELAAPIAVSNIEKFTDTDEHGNEVTVSSTPGHVKAAVTYNQYLKLMKLDNKYPLISEGDKLRYVRLLIPNPTCSDMLGFVHKLPPEFNVEKYIDRDHMYDRAIGNGLTTIATARQWTTKPVRTLRRFFSVEEHV